MENNGNRDQHGLRVCLLGQANPAAWMPHLVDAFQALGEVRTVGRVPESYPPSAWPRPWPPEGHVDVDLSTLNSLLDVLPTGWTPHLVVAVSGGGEALLTNSHDLPCPTVYYSVDTWQCYMDYLEALHYDVVFAGQQSFVARLRETGSPHVYWLPLACNPEMHHPVVTKRGHDVVFVGGVHKPVHWQRGELLDALRAQYSVSITDGVYGEAMCAALAGGRLAFNHSSVEDVNMRIFEALSMGCALLTNTLPSSAGLQTLFRDGEHLIEYSSKDELLAKTAQYLSDESALQRLREAGRAEVLARHTYTHRARTIVDTVAVLFPGFPCDGMKSERMPKSMLDLLPRAPGVVLDIGMGAGTSKYALARRGVTRFVGVSGDKTLFHHRQRSYHEAEPAIPKQWTGAFDTVLLDASHFNARHVDDAWQCLGPGGSLVGTISSLEPYSDFARWLLQHNFHLVQQRAIADEAVVFVARKRTRRLREIAHEVCDALQVPGVHGDHIASLLDPDW